MSSIRKRIKDPVITALILTLCFGCSVLMQNVFDIAEHITTTFVFAVFLISLSTDGYFYGIAAAFISVLAVNYIFTFPYFALNFIIPSNFYSAVVMIILSVMTSALTTKLKRQEAMKAEGEMERMRANLLRAVSHDLRTPLTSIYGASSAILDNQDTLTAAQKAKMLLDIQEDAQWLIRMVENLLSITRIDSGAVKILKTPTVLDELIDTVIVKFSKRYPTQEVLLELPEEIVVIPMDAILIEQVLTNLLENAVQHAHGMEHLWLRVTAGGGRAVFEIEDDGCGIARDRMERIFTGFFEAKDHPADSQKRSAGIGLSVCATIVRAHGGTIQAENKAAGGSLFRFTLHTEETEDEQ